MAVIDVLILLAFIAYAIAAGFRARRLAGQSLEEYFLAGRSLPGWKAGLSMAATQFAADTPLVVTGLIATAGVFALWRFWIYALAFLLLGFVLAGSWRRAQVLTDAELTELRYGRRPAAILRGVKAIYFGTIFNCTVLAMVLLAATRIAEPFLVWDQWLPAGALGPLARALAWIGVPITVVPADPTAWPADVWITSANNLLSILAIVGVTTLYSSTGGLRSVVATDVVQFTIMMVATAVFAWIVIDRAGGLGGLRAHLADRPELLAFTPSGVRDLSVAFVVVVAVQWFAQMNADGTGYLAQRAMACRSETDAKHAAVIFTIAQVLLRSLLWLPLALALMVLFPAEPGFTGDARIAEREATFVRGIQSLPPGVMGLMLTAMLAALASTVDTHLNWGASYWTNDIYQRFICRGWLGSEASDRTLVWVARGANVLILIVALVIMFNLGSIQSAWRASLLLGAGMGGPLLLRWFWWRLTAWGELGAIAGALLMLPIVLGAMEPGPARFLVMAFAPTALAIAISLLFGPEEMEQLVAFYQRSRPPGFWGPVATAAGIDAAHARRQLWRGLGATFSGAFALFCLLTGVGSWLIGSPSPRWLPAWFPWIATLLAISAALALVCLRLARRD